MCLVSGQQDGYCEMEHSEQQMPSLEADPSGAKWFTISKRDVNVNSIPKGAVVLLTDGCWFIVGKQASAMSQKDVGTLVGYIFSPDGMYLCYGSVYVQSFVAAQRDVSEPILHPVRLRSIQARTSRKEEAALLEVGFSGLFPYAPSRVEQHEWSIDEMREWYIGQATRTLTPHCLGG